MAALLPTILSDDDECNHDNGSNRIIKKGGGKTKSISSNKTEFLSSKATKQVPTEKDIDVDDGGDDDNDDDEMDQDFEFGGLLVRLL